MPLARSYSILLVSVLLPIPGGGPFAGDPANPGAIPEPSVAAGTLIPVPALQETGKRGILIRGEGVWLDPPPSGRAGHPQPPVPSRFSPNLGESGPYFGPQRSIYPGYGGFERRRSTGWLDSFCPSPKRRPGWPDQPGYPRWTDYPERRGYGNVLTNQPPYGPREPWGR